MGCVWALGFLFLLLRPATANVLPQPAEEPTSASPIFNREDAPSIRNPVLIEESSTTSSSTAATTTTPVTVKTTVAETTKAPTTTTTTTARSTTTEVPARTTTTSRYKLYLRAMNALNQLLTKPNPLHLLKKSVNISAENYASTHAGFLSRSSVIAPTTPANLSPSTAITSRPKSPPTRVDAISGERRALGNSNHIQALLSRLLTNTPINNRWAYNSKRMFQSDTHPNSQRINSTSRDMAIGILRALWNDLANNGSEHRTKYVPIALTAPSTASSTAKSIIFGNTKNRIVSHTPTNLITIHNFNSSPTELGPDNTSNQDHLFHPSDYDHWDEISQPTKDTEDNYIGNSEEIAAHLPISIKRTPSVTSTITVRPKKVKNPISVTHVNDIYGAGQLNSYEDQVGEIKHDLIIDKGSYKPKKKNIKQRKKVIKNKSKKQPVTTPTGSLMVIVTEEEYGTHDQEEDNDDDPVDPDPEPQQTYITDQDTTVITETAIVDDQQQQQLEEEQPLSDNNGDEGLFPDETTEAVKTESYCPRGNKFSADQAERCSRQNKKRPKKKFHYDGEIQEDSDLNSRHDVKIKPPKVPKIKVPKIKVPKVKVPKVKVPKVKVPDISFKDMQAMMKTFFTGVSVATMYNPFNFGLWSVVLHPVTMLLVGLGGVLMYCFPWTSVAMLTSRKNPGRTIEVHRLGRRINSRPGAFVKYESQPVGSDWLEDQALWILGVINNYTFQTNL